MDETILVVDDDAAFRRIVCSVLEAGGYETVTATSADEARAAVMRDESGHDIGAAVVSIELRTGGGETLIHDLAQASPDAEVIVLANATSLERLMELYDAGNIYNHRWKPLDDIGDLVRDVARALERRMLKRQKAYLLTQLRDTRDEVRAQAEWMVQAERLAVAGRVTADMQSWLAGALGEIGDAAERLRTALEAPRPHRTERINACIDAVTRGAAETRELLTVLQRFAAGPAATCDERMVQPIQVADAVFGALAVVRPTLEASAVTMVCDLPDDVPAVRADADALREALTHLMMNAALAMPDGGTLRITAQRAPETLEAVRILIRDSGCGVPPSALPRVFEPFFTTRQAPPTSYATGLGLTVARASVRAMGGDITLDSVHHIGTTATVTLPAALSRAVPPPAAAARHCDSQREMAAA